MQRMMGLKKSLMKVKEKGLNSMNCNSKKRGKIKTIRKKSSNSKMKYTILLFKKEINY